MTREELGRLLFGMFSGPAWSCWGDHGEKGKEHWYKQADAILSRLSSASPAPAVQTDQPTSEGAQ